MAKKQRPIFVPMRIRGNHPINEAKRAINEYWASGKRRPRKFIISRVCDELSANGEAFIGFSVRAA